LKWKGTSPSPTSGSDRDRSEGRKERGHEAEGERATGNLGKGRVCLGNGVVLTSKITPPLGPGDTALHRRLFLFGGSRILEARGETLICAVTN